MTWLTQKCFKTAAVLSVAMAIGCGGGSGQKPVAKVSGKVMYDGKPVTEGVLALFPVGTAKTSENLKPGSATVQKDGTFKVSTYGQFDGAIIGKHRISYTAPTAEAPPAAEGAHAQPAPPSQFADLTPESPEIDIKPGENNIEIKLISPSKSSSGGSSSGGAHGQ